MNKAIKKENQYEINVNCNGECDDTVLFVLDVEQMYPPEFFDCPRCKGPDWVSNILELEPSICKSAVTWMLHNRDLTVEQAWKKCTNAGWMLYLIEELEKFGLEQDKCHKVCDLYYNLELDHDDFEAVWSNGRPYTKDMKKLMAIIRKLFPNPPQSLNKKVEREKPRKKAPKCDDCGVDYTCDEHE